MQDPYLHIEEYIAGNLSVKDINAFEAAMANDERLRQAVEDFDLVGLIGEALLEEEIAGIVGKELEKDESENNESLSSTTILKWLAAIGVVLLLGWWITKESPSDKKHRELIAQYIYPENKSTRSLNNSTTKLDSAIYLFDLRKMKDSEKLFLEILAIDSTQQDANFYMAHISFLKQEYVLCRKYNVSLNSSVRLKLCY